LSEILNQPYLPIETLSNSHNMSSAISLLFKVSQGDLDLNKLILNQPISPADLIKNQEFINKE
jgi:hypothetical protein